MRVNSRMRAPASRVSTPRAILAAFAIGAVAALSLAGCGQRGPLYMPKVPPLPQKPNFETQTDDNAQPTPATALPASGVQAGELPDTSGTPLSLSPDAELKSVPASGAQPDLQPASAAAPNQ
ncbi:LPS translocon maturation chaperone LptM [Paraburkholderia sacchari]|uniref:Lipoprotein n=2 Tax=Paraburkholderia sacchari TaxID=159450 RepID=A0A8T6ZPU0_9BURK|nr:lipoprotein [Paraburkholderia sacchari]NLP65279.1 lipoprotein [Paraburkholderia sacchari]